MATADGDVGRVGGEYACAVEQGEPAILARVKRHRGDDAHAQAQLDIGFDDIRIERGEDDVGQQARIGKYAVNRAAAGEAFVVGDQRILGQRGQREPCHPGQRVADGHDDRVMPGVPGEGG